MPARPDSRIPKQLALSAPCTSRKSVTLDLRREACCTMTLSAVFLTPAMRVTTTNAGSSVQKSKPKVRSSPANPPVGMPAQAASRTDWRS